MGGQGTLYYNAAAGPLPRAPRALKLKAGLNAWAEMLHAVLAPVPELPGWWAADLELGEVRYDSLRYPFAGVGHSELAPVAELPAGGPPTWSWARWATRASGTPLPGWARVRLAASMGSKGLAKYVSLGSVSRPHFACWRAQGHVPRGLCGGGPRVGRDRQQRRRGLPAAAAGRAERGRGGRAAPGRAGGRRARAAGGARPAWALRSARFSVHDMIVLTARLGASLHMFL